MSQPYDNTWMQNAATAQYIPYGESVIRSSKLIETGYSKNQVSDRFRLSVEDPHYQGRIPTKIYFNTYANHVGNSSRLNFSQATHGMRFSQPTTYDPRAHMTKSLWVKEPPIQQVQQTHQMHETNYEVNKDEAYRAIAPEFDPVITKNRCNSWCWVIWGLVAALITVAGILFGLGVLTPQKIMNIGSTGTKPNAFTTASTSIPTSSNLKNEQNSPVFEVPTSPGQGFNITISTGITDNLVTSQISAFDTPIGSVQSSNIPASTTNDVIQPTTAPDITDSVGTQNNATTSQVPASNVVIQPNSQIASIPATQTTNDQQNKVQPVDESSKAGQQADKFISPSSTPSTLEITTVLPITFVVKPEITPKVVVEQPKPDFYVWSPRIPQSTPQFVPQFDTYVTAPSNFQKQQFDSYGMVPFNYQTAFNGPTDQISTAPVTKPQQNIPAQPAPLQTTPQSSFAPQAVPSQSIPQYIFQTQPSAFSQTPSQSFQTSPGHHLIRQPTSAQSAPMQWK